MAKKKKKQSALNATIDAKQHALKVIGAQIKSLSISGDPLEADCIETIRNLCTVTAYLDQFERAEIQNETIRLLKKQMGGDGDLMSLRVKPGSDDIEIAS
mgnify:CR=1 FL=1|tara:strand:+ start:6214 stop:6513 length:300 start_codon:yes stop_codon:yes gene_type:complete